MDVQRYLRRVIWDMKMEVYGLKTVAFGMIILEYHQSSLVRPRLLDFKKMKRIFLASLFLLLLPQVAWAEDILRLVIIFAMVPLVNVIIVITIRVMFLNKARSKAGGKGI